MTRTQAIERYFATNVRAQRIIERMQKWDENLTIKENIYNTKIACHSNAVYFSRRFGLKFQRVNKPGIRNAEYYKKSARRLEAFRVLKAAGLQYNVIGQLFGVTRQNVHNTIARSRVFTKAA